MGRGRREVLAEDRGGGGAERLEIDGDKGDWGEGSELGWVRLMEAGMGVQRGWMCRWAMAKGGRRAEEEEEEEEGERLTLNRRKGRR